MRQVGLAAAGAAGQCQQRAPICVPVLVPGVGGWHGLHATLAHAFHPLQEYQSGAQPVLSEEEQRLRVRGGIGKARCMMASACCSLLQAATLAAHTRPECICATQVQPPTLCPLPLLPESPCPPCPTPHRSARWRLRSWRRSWRGRRGGPRSWSRSLRSWGRVRVGWEGGKLRRWVACMWLVLKAATHTHMLMLLAFEQVCVSMPLPLLPVCPPTWLPASCLPFTSDGRLWAVAGQAGQVRGRGGDQGGGRRIGTRVGGTAPVLHCLCAHVTWLPFTRSMAACSRALCFACSRPLVSKQRAVSHASHDQHNLPAPTPSFNPRSAASTASWGWAHEPWPTMRGVWGWRRCGRAG